MANWTLTRRFTGDHHAVTDAFRDFLREERVWLEVGGRPHRKPTLRDRLKEARWDVKDAKARVRRLKKEIKRERR